MKPIGISLLAAIILAFTALLFYSCKKETPCKTCQTNQPTSNTNKTPIALAGIDLTVTLPADSILLDGSASNDPDGKITVFQWTKISGPSSFFISNAHAVRPQIFNLVEGTYSFELKVTDAGGLFAKDTLNVTVAQSKTESMNIYVGGSAGGAAQYWKNGIAVNLPNGTQGRSIYVSGNDVYVAGQQNLGGGIYQVAKYWKNGIAVNLTDEINYSGANDIYVLGNDTYVAGWGSGGNFQAKYWKNGIAVNLPTGWEATSIYVSDNDVYVAGYDSGQVAKYWKNGIGVNLSTNVSGYSSANDIFVSGNDVFLAGVVGEMIYYGYGYSEKGPPSAVYWRNGMAINLPNGSEAHSIYVSGNDVYVAGRGYDGNNSIAKYWKNGIAVTLPNGTQAKSIYVSGADVYVAGDNNGRAKYWKNGAEVSLSNEPSQSWANSIVVVPR